MVYTDLHLVKEMVHFIRFLAELRSKDPFRYCVCMIDTKLQLDS